MENNSRKEDIELIAAKYEFDFAQSVVGEKKWDYERAYMLMRQLSHATNSIRRITGDSGNGITARNIRIIWM